MLHLEHPSKPLHLPDFLCHLLLQIYQWKNFNIRDDSHIRDAIKRSNVIINLCGLDKETWNFSFEDVHINAATRIAQAAADNPLTERFIQFSCIGASEIAASRRLRTKVCNRTVRQPCYMA